VLDLWPVIVLAVTQVVDAVAGLAAGPASAPALLRRVVAVLSASLLRIGVRLAATFAELREDFSWLGTWAGARLDVWWLATVSGIRALTVDHPTVRYLRSFAGELSVFSAWRERDAGAAATTTPPPSPGFFSGIVDPSLLKIGMPSFTPRLPTLPKLPHLLPLGTIGARVDLTQLLRSLGYDVGPANPLEPGAKARQVLERATRPPSVFGTEWRALEAEARRPEPLARTLEFATYLSLARRVVGPAAAASVRGLEDVLSRIDAVVRTERRRLPVKDVPEPTQLAPVIGRLRVTSRGRGSEAMRGWVADLRRELDAAGYAVPAGG
jgi:hypothetical protein